MFYQHLSLRVICFLSLGYSIATAATVLTFEGRSDGENLEIEETFTIETSTVLKILGLFELWNEQYEQYYSLLFSNNIDFKF